MRQCMRAASLWTRHHGASLRGSLASVTPGQREMAVTGSGEDRQAALSARPVDVNLARTPFPPPGHSWCARASSPAALPGRQGFGRQTLGLGHESRCASTESARVRRPDAGNADLADLAIEDGERLEMLARLRGAPSPRIDLEGAIDSGWSAIPRALSTQILHFFDQPFGPSVLRIRNVPIDQELPSTPSNGAPSDAKETYVAEAVLLGVARHAGQPIGFEGLKGGLIVHDIAPVQGAEEAQSNEGSATSFALHTEVAASDHRPTHVALLCLRSDHRNVARTVFSSARLACRRLAPEVLETLSKPLFTTGAPQSFKLAYANVERSEPAAVLLGPTSCPELRLNMQTTDGLTSAARRALEELKSALASDCSQFAVTMQPGDLVLFDNRKVLHGRTAFQPRYDGKDRWLLRVYTRPDTWAHRSGDPASDPRLIRGIAP